MDPQLLSKQVELEQLYNKNQTVTRIKKEFSACADADFIGYMEAVDIPIPFGIDVLTQMALHKRATLPTMVGLLKHHFNDAQLTADMLLKCAMADLMDWNPTTEQFVVRYTISQDVQDELDRFQFPLPMVVEPMPVIKNTDTGYVMGNGSVILRKNHHNDDVCLDHINRMNRIRFVIDQDTARMVKNQWRNLDKPKEGETKADFEKRKRAFEKYDRTAKDVIGVISKASPDGASFYLTHKYDKRGRTYCQGYHINYQGAPWNKAVVQLAEKELVA